MTYQRLSFHYLRIIIDLFFILLSFIFTEYMINGLVSLDKNHIFIFFILSLTWIISAKATGLYDEFRSRNFSYEFISLLKNVILQPLMCVVIVFMFKEIQFPRVLPIVYAGFLILIVGSQKYLFRQLLNVLRLLKRNIRTVLIIGAGEVGKKFYNTIKTNPHFGYTLLGFLDDKKTPSLNGEYLGKINDLEKVLEKTPADNVIIALPNYATEKLEYIINICERHTTRVRIIPDYFRFMSSKYSLSMFGKFPIISVRNDRLSELHCRLAKRIFDFIFSLFVIIFIFSWLFPLIIFAIKISSPGPVIFRQERWGRNNKKFWTYKFRSMWNGNHDIDQNGKYRQATYNDSRITKIGKFLRKTNLDELPQFYNVLKGNMSIVGPRPHPIPLNLESRENIKHYMLRHLVKPGITGWAQVHGYRGSTEDPKLMQKRIDFDLWYIENWSLWLDIQIVMLTVWNMIKGDPHAY